MIPLFFAYALSADLVDYDGKTLVFSQHFQIEHPLGHLTGEKAVLINLSLPLNKGTQKNPIQVQLENKVLLDACNAPIPLSISSQRARCDLPPKNIFSTLQSQEIEFYENVIIKSPFDIYRRRPLILDSERQSSIEAQSSEREGPIPIGKGDEEDRLGEVATSPTSKFQADGGIIAKGGSAVYQRNKITLYPSPLKSHCQLQHDENWILAEKIIFDLSLMEMICLSAHGYRAENALFFSADAIRLSLTKEFQPTLLLLEGNVALRALYQNKKSFALADAVSYKIEGKELLLTAAPTKKVLFWQDGLELSAPQLRITDAIEGIGDIHFMLNTEQKNQLLQIFSRYL